MMHRPWVRIVIVTFNSGIFTQECIDALAAQTEGGFEAVIVDNQSTDGAVDKLILPDFRFSFTMLDENVGFSEGSNVGLRGARTPYVMTINPDCSLDPNCLNALLTATKLNPEHAMFSPLLYKSGERRVLDGAGDSLSIFGLAWRNGGGAPVYKHHEVLSKPFIVFGPSGAAALYKRQEFERAGGFDKNFFCYLEDVDLALRLRAKGGSCLLIPDAIGIHIGGHSSNRIDGFALERSVQNNIGMIIKSVPYPLLPIMIAFHLLSHSWFQFRNAGSGIAQTRSRAFRKGVKSIPIYVISRFQRKPYPFGATFRVARALSWSVRDMKLRHLFVLRG